MRFVSLALTLLAASVLIAVDSTARAHEADMAGPQTHRMVPATITKVDASMIFVQPPQGLRPRVISIRKAERMGLYDARVGESVMLIVDEGDVMVDVHRMTPPPQGHRLLEGMLDYADPYWGTIRVATPEGKETYAMDSLAASKLSAMHDHTAVRLELDEDNMVIDIHPTH